MASELALRVRDLRVELTSGTDVVDGVSFDLPPGDVLGLVGESGCGKTSVAMALLNHARQGARIAGGQVLLGDLDVLRQSARAGRRLRGSRISYVPQDPSRSLNPRKRVGRQIDEVLRVHGRAPRAPDSTVGTLLEAVRLPTARDFLRRYPHQLSGGQQQRVLLVMALACNPEVVVLDEPTTGLDVTTQAHVLEAVRSLRELSGSSFVYVTHDLAVLARIATRIGVMYAGRLIEEADAPTIFTAPAHPYTARLILTTPSIRDPEPRDGIAGTAPPPGARPSGCFFAPRCTMATPTCDATFPEPEPVTQGHMVRCHRWRDGVGHLMTRPARERRSRPDTSVLVVDGLGARYGSGSGAHVVLSEVSVGIAAGECVGLVGESGSGKSTFARCVAGLHPPSTGSIRLDEAEVRPDVRDRSSEQRRAIQLVFQNPDRSLNPRQTVAAQIARPLELFSLVGDRGIGQTIAELLERVRLPASFASRYPGELSGGEKQRVAIARALAAQPRLLLCDEVTSALDVSVQAAVVNLLDELRRDGELAILFISHDLGVINWIADRVLVLNRGIICEEGETRALLGAPRDPYTRELIAASPELPVAS